MNAQDNLVGPKNHTGRPVTDNRRAFTLIELLADRSVRASARVRGARPRGGWRVAFDCFRAASWRGSFLLGGLDFLPRGRVPKVRNADEGRPH